MMKEWIVNTWNQLKLDLAKLHKSSTIWFFGSIGVLAANLPIIQEQLPQLKEYLPQDIYQFITAVCVVGGILLRFKTKTALRDKE